MLYSRHCALSTCGIKFETDNSRKLHCTRQHSVLDRVRRHKARKRKKGGGGDDGGGGGRPLVEAIQTVDPKATYTIASDKGGSRYSVKSGKKKPSESVTSGPLKKAYKAAA